MNRIILIGNGFDLAHGFETRYGDFVKKFWENQIEEAKKFPDWKGENGHFVFENDFFKLKTKEYRKYTDTDIATLKQDISYYKNNFLERIEKVRVITNWVDLEELYYRELLYCLKIEKDNNDAFVVSPIKKLNDDFNKIRQEFEKYLSDNIKNQIIDDKKLDEIDEKIWRGIDEKKDKVLFLNFNYTDTEKLYTKKKRGQKQVIDENKNIVIHIHGEVNNPDNPMIFGYGDELAVDFKDIENTNRNEFLENAKSIKYLETANYDDLLEFIKDEYEVFIFGHSCGNSDRTLLNTIFENPNCTSIVPFFYKENKDKDNYSEIVKNISRSFTKDANSKSNLRKLVKKHKECEPLYYEGKLKADLDKFLEKYFVKIVGGKEYALIEEPDKKQKINTFYLGKYQVRQDLYMQIMSCKNPSHFNEQNNLPVEQVSWYDCAEFCNKLSEKYGLDKRYQINGVNININDNAKGFRLPTENEWEYAATSRGFYNDMNDFARNKETDKLEDLGWYIGNSEGRTHPVGQKQPNDLGLYDMSGNVWEWCEDFYDSEGSNRVLRGGSWKSPAACCRVAYRGYNSPGNRNDALGFRVVLP